MKSLLMMALLMTGCASALPGSENVLFTKDVHDVIGCKVVDQTGVRILETVKGKTYVFAKGGDTYFTPAHVIYNCHGRDARQPVPVAPTKGD